MTGAAVHFLVPEGLDDDARVSGGNVYDRRVRDGLRALGREVAMHTDPAAIPDGALVLVDGLVLDETSVDLVDRCTAVVLAHMLPQGPDAQRAVRAAAGVLTTSEWTRTELLGLGLADPHRTSLARPGTDHAPVAHRSADGGNLLAVGAVVPHKGQDVLVAALARLRDLDGWTCTIAGSLDTDPGFVAEVRAAAGSAGIADRLRFPGVLTGRELRSAYHRADLFVAPTRSESYGMAIADALAAGVPVVASRTGGVPEVVPDDGAGVLVPPDDPWAVMIAVRTWLTRPEVRATMRAAALDARTGARTWSDCVRDVERALPAGPDQHSGAQCPLDCDPRDLSGALR